MYSSFDCLWAITLLKFPNFETPILKYLKIFPMRLVKLRLFSVSLMELKADPSGVSLRPLACRDGGF
jgi:hypothetical protein